MINYSSINDAWGKKEIYKKKQELNNSELNNSQNNNIQNNNTQNNNTQNNNIQNNNTQDNMKNNIVLEHPTIEKFQSCNVIEHIANCNECRNKLKYLFTQNNEMITLPGCNIKISKDTLKILFILIIFCIILLFISIINDKQVPALNKYMYLPYNYYQ